MIDARLTNAMAPIGPTVVAEESARRQAPALPAGRAASSTRATRTGHSARPSTIRSAPRGFTLIELLITVSIIAIMP